MTKYNIRKGNIMQHLIPSMQHLFAEKVDSWQFWNVKFVVFLEMILIKNSNRLLVAHSGLAGYVKQSQKHFTERRLVPI